MQEFEKVRHLVVCGRLYTCIPARMMCLSAHNVSLGVHCYKKGTVNTSYALISSVRTPSKP